MNKKLLESSIFYIMGCAFDKPLNYIAYLYRMSLPEFIDLLGGMGYSDEVIRSQIKPAGYPEHACKHCGIITTGIFCTRGCAVSYRRKQTILQNIELTGTIPTTIPNITYQV